MERVNTKSIVLTRVDYGEADRIITFLTPAHGKISAMAKGVRKSRAKLAGSVELFSVSDITYIPGRGSVATLISARLVKHYGNIVKDIDRTQAAYDFLKTLNRATEDNPEAAYFKLLSDILAGLDDENVDLNLIRAWFSAQLVKLAGHSPNLLTDAEGYKLDAGKQYDFDFESMSFNTAKSAANSFKTDDIKFLRLLFSTNPPKILQKVQEADGLAQKLVPLTQSMLSAHVRL